MSDDAAVHGLGAIPDDPDERDFPIDALYAADDLVPTPLDALPASYVCPGMPPVLDQGDSPMCVAYSSSAIKARQDRLDQLRFFDFDEPRFFREIGGTSAGAQVRWAMERMRTTGYPVVRTGDPAHHRIAAYYAVPAEFGAMHQAIVDLGPIVVSTPWYRSWFHPVAGVLPEPDVEVGGHAIAAYGWDARGLLLRNSWGSGWGMSGDCILPAVYIARTRGAWKSADVIDHPLTYSHVVAVTASPSLRVRTRPTVAAPQVASAPRGRQLPTHQLERYGGRYTATGKARTDWLQVTSGGHVGWVARGYTRLVK